MLITIGTGRSTASILDAAVVPRYRISRNPVVYLHGVNGTASQPFTASPATVALFAALQQAGFTVVAPTLNALWGIGATFATRMADIIAWSRSEWGASSAKPILIGESHGAGSAINYMADNPANVACFVGIIPAIDYQAIRVSDPYAIGARASIDTAAGVVYPAALPAGTNPATRTAGITGIPQQLWADTTTPDLISENVAAYASAVGADLHATLTNAHSEASIAQVDVAAVVAFVQAHTA